MFMQDDNTYNDIREKSLLQWLSEMEKHEDVAVRGGVKLAREYMEHLKAENKKLQDENELKNAYLKKASAKVKQAKMDSMKQTIEREPEIPDCGCIYG